MAEDRINNCPYCDGYGVIGERVSHAVGDTYAEEDLGWECPYCHGEPDEEDDDD